MSVTGWWCQAGACGVHSCSPWSKSPGSGAACMSVRVRVGAVGSRTSLREEALRGCLFQAGTGACSEGTIFNSAGVKGLEEGLLEGRWDEVGRAPSGGGHTGVLISFCC